MTNLSADNLLPRDHAHATLVGRVWIAEPIPGPRTVVVRNSTLHDISTVAPTLSDLFDMEEPASRIKQHTGDALCSLEQALAQQRLLAPCDLQAIKASGVTFADSIIERVLEERARGDAEAAAKLRRDLTDAFGGSLAGLTPGSDAAALAKQVLIRDGLWSQYLEVGIGPDPEIFTKAQPMSAVGYGAEIGLHPKSQWNNPEPEIVLAVSSRGDIVGASLGNDVNLRDFEGRSALLLGKAKDNNASCAIGPFVRLFDNEFNLDDVLSADVDLSVTGEEGFIVEGTNSMQHISRHPSELVRATFSESHQYPDGFMLFLGTMFIPTKDRLGPGTGFTHKVGDRVKISSPKLGTLINTVTTSDKAPPWTFGVRALMESIAKRGLLKNYSANL